MTTRRIVHARPMSCRCQTCRADSVVRTVVRAVAWTVAGVVAVVFAWASIVLLVVSLGGS